MKNLTQTLKSLALALIFIGGISYALAWTNPTQLPPNGNVEAPINTSSSAQYKIGSLSLGTTTLNSSYILFASSSAFFTGAVAASNLIAGAEVDSPKYCDQNGANCHQATEIGSSGVIILGGGGWHAVTNKISKAGIDLWGVASYTGGTVVCSSGVRILTSDYYAEGPSNDNATGKFFLCVASSAVGVNYDPLAND